MAWLCSALFASATLPAYAQGRPLFSYRHTAEAVAPQHALDGRINFQLDLERLARLVPDETLDLQLPDQSKASASVTRHDELVQGARRHTVLSLAGGKGSIEFSEGPRGVDRVRINIVQGSVRVYEARLDTSGSGELVAMNAGDYYCIRMPADQQVGTTILPAAPAGTPSLEQIKHLQSKPAANHVLYLNYWGGVLSGTSWNDDYNSGMDISYTPYSYDFDATGFSDVDLQYMWIAWQEAAEDYAPFDVNVTTDQAVYQAARSADRSMIIATTSDEWFGSSAGGVANLDSFGNDYSGIGWAWNSSITAFGQTAAHEAGHQMGLHHDGAEPSTEYYGGQGANYEWGPIMGAPFGYTFVQWSKGEYPKANNKEDDLAVITAALGADQDWAGDTTTDAYLLAPSSYIQGVIEPQGLLGGLDTDVYRFELPSARNMTIEIIPVLGDNTLRYGSNLALDAQLIGRDGVTVLAQSNQAAPYYPQDNILTFNGVLQPGSYHLVVVALSPNPDWSTGFGEYGNAGRYAISLESNKTEPDLTSALQVADRDVYVGQLVSVSGEALNIGMQDAAMSTLRFFRSQDSTISPADDSEQAARTTPILSPQQAEYISEQIVMPDSAGSYYMGSCVDTVSGETALDNNCSAGVYINVSDLGQDLDIGAALEQSSFNWLRGGDGSFFRQTAVSINDGDAAQSGAIANNESSYLQAEVNGPGWLSFQWKVSSEPDFDFFRFQDNGVEVAAISGETDWVALAHVLDAGVHTLRWRYDKDPFTVAGQDAAWLDNVTFFDRRFSITAQSAPQLEGDSGATTYTFSVVSEGNNSGPASVAYTVTGAGDHPADGVDFGGSLPGGRVEFVKDQQSAEITVHVSGDELLEPDEVFAITLGDPQGGLLGDPVAAQATILNDDLDSDSDGVKDFSDNCPADFNPDQRNTDQDILPTPELPGGDALGDACDADDDADGVEDDLDNCPLDRNPDQVDICSLCFPLPTEAGAMTLICL